MPQAQLFQHDEILTLVGGTGTNVYSDNLSYVAVASTLSVRPPITLSDQNVLSLTFSNPGNGAITLQYGNTVAALKGGSNILLSSSFDGTYIQISADLSSCAKLVTNDPYKEIALDNVIKIASNGVNSFYIFV